MSMISIITVVLGVRCENFKRFKGNKSIGQPKRHRAKLIGVSSPTIKRITDWIDGTTTQQPKYEYILSLTRLLSQRKDDRDLINITKYLCEHTSQTATPRNLKILMVVSFEQEMFEELEILTELGLSVTWNSKHKIKQYSHFYKLLLQTKNDSRDFKDIKREAVEAKANYSNKEVKFLFEYVELLMTYNISARERSILNYPEFKISLNKLMEKTSYINCVFMQDIYVVRVKDLLLKVELKLNNLKELRSMALPLIDDLTIGQRIRSSIIFTYGSSYFFECYNTFKKYIELASGTYKKLDRQHDYKMVQEHLSMCRVFHKKDFDKIEHITEIGKAFLYYQQGNLELSKKTLDTINCPDREIPFSKYLEGLLEKDYATKIGKFNNSISLFEGRHDYFQKKFPELAINTLGKRGAVAR
ncbi:AimR family lysis-lysogeny pheromone receptor (plasmid) [Bacillus carboniphilus]|uniref:AimR family lysis-lysogeny pheromone receptor n=1 Tax=Bacillus carboniphilus TaxID=86663 RepID=A0ABY9K090_9BACI|nr:AimR family lysis-lysogeny pheromone receptor [Bacillus carboniphilus]WLR44429.1 AimR family lysis-lysogeny pheromone receptor [Bacillus carboniphilus]